MKKKWSVILASILACTMLLSACSSSEQPSQNAEPDSPDAVESADGGETPDQPTERSGGSDIVAAVDSDFVTMDPADATMTMDGAVQRLIMDGLFGFDEDMNVIPMLATEYDANDNATEYVITLREGISFSDGTPWNADAAKANLDKLADQSLGLKRNGLFNMIDHTDVVDEYTVQVFLNTPFGAFINTLAHPAGVMMSPVQIEAGPEVCAQNPVGTGQYTFVEWFPGDHLTIALNPGWWGYDAGLSGGTALVAANAGFDTITFKPVTESATRVAMIQSGDADFIYPVPTESYEVLEADPNVNAQSSESIVMTYCYLNTQKEGLSDVRVREAINLAVNREAFCQVVFNGLASPADSYMSPKTQFYVKQGDFEYNLEKAQELMNDAGYGDGLDLKLYVGTSTAAVKAGEFIQQQLEQIGINVNVNPIETGTRTEVIDSFTGPGSEAEHDMYYWGWSPSTGDADWVLRAIFSITLSPPNGSAFAYFDNDEFEAAIQQGLGSADLSVRADAYAKAQEILWTQYPAIPLGNSFNTWATNDKVQNLGRYPDGGIYFRDGVYVG